MPQPYLRKPYDSPHYGRMSDLIRQQGAITAGREQENAQRAALLATNIADIAGQSLGAIARFKADEPRQKRITQQIAKEEKAERRGENLRGIEMMHADLPLEEQEKTLRREGFGKEANVVRQQQQQETQMALARIQQHKTAFGQAAQYMQEVKQRPELYPQVRPHMVELANLVDDTGQLATNIPETYDPKSFEPIMGFVREAAGATETAERSLLKLNKAHDNVARGLKGEQDFREAVGIGLSRANSKEEWDTLKAGYRTRGVPAESIDEFGEWDKDAPQRALDKTLTPAQIEQRKQQELTREEQRKTREAGASVFEQYRALPPGPAREQFLRDVSRVESAGRAPQREVGGITAAGRATAARARDNTIRDIEDMVVRETAKIEKITDPKSEERLTAIKDLQTLARSQERRAVASFYEQVGEAPPPEEQGPVRDIEGRPINRAIGVPEAPEFPPPDTPGAELPVRETDIGLSTPPPPPAVARVMQKEQAGIAVYLEDGSVWTKDLDGRIRQVQPRRVAPPPTVRPRPTMGDLARPTMPAGGERPR